MTGGRRIDHYSWRGGREAMLRFGPDDGPRVILAMPLYEEANRTRAFAVDLLRELATRGIGSLLPDLPGSGESLIVTRDATLTAMREAYAGLAGDDAFAVGIRSGALLDHDARLRGRWHLSPIDGADLVRELARVANGAGLYAGNAIGDEMMRELATATPTRAAARIVRLNSDPREADLKLAGGPLWRRAEPDKDPVLAAAAAQDIATWIATCGA